jgi:Ca2+-binding RTX toxin-like protein
MFGGSGRDWLNDFEGANVLDGGEGPDVLSSGPGNETIVGGSGWDAVSYVETLSGGGSGSHCNDITADMSQGTAQGTDFGADTLQDVESVWTGGGNDVLIGDDGPNAFYTGGFPCDESPTDSVSGNGGADRITFNSELAELGSGPGPVRVDLVEHTARWSNQGSGFIVITLASIENVTGTEGRDVILGDAQPNELSGGSDSPGRWGSDVIRGRGGADSLSGRGGNDWLYGGRGPDRIRGGYGSDHLFGGLGHNQNDGGKGIDVCRRPRQGGLAVSCER